MVRKHIIVSGRVQGVGFRYICQSFASKYQCTGWVKNNFDGTVEMEVQGLDHRVDAFVEDVRTGHRFARVRSLQIENIEPLRALNEKGFRIRY